MYKNIKESKEDLFKYILLFEKNKQNIIFDFDFALRLFKKTEITELVVVLYGLMDFFELSVNLALEKNNIELAKEYALKPPNEDLKKKLYLKIAIH